MRQRLEKEKGSKNPFDIKQAAGGLVDVEFIAQYLMLRHAAEHPGCLSTTTPDALRRLAALGLLDPSAAEILIGAARLYQGLTQLLRLAIDGDFSPAEAPRGLSDLLLRAADAPDLTRLEAQLVETQQKTREIFLRLLEK